MNNPAALSAALKGDFENAMIASTPGGIERQEKQGQADLVSNFTRLPKEFGYNNPFPTELLERLGFKIGGEVDELFLSVAAPAGWRMQATDHSMHSDIIDDQGRVRGSVFYKAAFYDRKANFHLARRYTVEEEYDAKDKPYADWRRRVYLKDGADDAHLVDYEWRANSDSEQVDADRVAARAELLKRFPDADSIEAYW